MLGGCIKIEIYIQDPTLLEMGHSIVYCVAHILTDFIIKSKPYHPNDNLDNVANWFLDNLLIE